MSIKISVLGAGSSVFSANLIKDICLTESLRDSDICFMDIDEKRLRAACALCSRLADELGTPLKITGTTDRAACMRGADFIVDTILIGGYQHYQEGWDIAEKWGYRRGGSLHIMHDEAFWINFHQLRMMEGVVQDMKCLCPDAWLLMVANPVMAGTTYLRRKYPEIKMVGLCHGTSMIRFLLPMLGLDPKKVTCQIPGVNHFVWMNHFYYEGKDAFPILDKWIREHSAEHFKTCKYSSLYGPKVFDLYRRYGVLPIGDTASPGGGSWGYDYHSSREVEEKWREDPKGWFTDYLKSNGARVARIEEVALDPSKSVAELVGREKSYEPMIPLIESLACGVEHNVIVNVLNERGYVPGIPNDFAVEVPAFCGRQGIQPIATDRLPEPILARAMRDRVAPVNMELAAYDAHDLEMLVDLVMMDPWSRSREQAAGLVHEILDLPFHAEMKEWYR